MSEEVKTVAGEETAESQTTETTSGAQVEDLDNILSQIDKEFDKATKIPEQKIDPKDNRIAELERTVDTLMKHHTTGDVDKAVDAVVGELGEDVKLPKRAIRGMLNDMAVEDPRLLRAFENRWNDPAGWNRVLKAAAKSIRKEFSGFPDRKLNEDREALAAAVRGASKTSVTEDAPNFSKMTDQEFDRWKLGGR